MGEGGRVITSTGLAPISRVGVTREHLQSLDCGEKRGRDFLLGWGCSQVMILANCSESDGVDFGVRGR